MAVPARPVPGNPIASDWGDAAHDTAVAQDIQSGSVQVSLSNTNNGSATVVFPRPFAGTPGVVVSVAAGSTTMVAGVGAPSPTQFNALLFRKDETSTTLTATVNWVAVGPRA